MKIILLFLLVIHIIAAIVYAIYILTGRSYLRREQILFVIFLPIFGPLAGILVEYLNRSGKQGDTKLDIPILTLGDDIYWEAIKREQEDRNIVPLEEAILINDEKTRRKLILETLYDNPMKYLDVLMVARYNDDVETAHYATTTISRVQRQYQLEIQKTAVDVENNPDDLELLDDYIDLIGEYIESGLLEDYLLKRQRVLYAKALDQKLARTEDDKDTLIKKMRNHIELGEYASAYEVSNILKINWPRDERVWIEALRVCVESRNKERFDETLAIIRTANIDWTEAGRAEVSLWLEGRHA